MLKTITSVVAYQLAWCASAYGASQGTPGVGIAVCAAALGLSLALADAWKPLGLLALSLGLFGWVAESSMLAADLVFYSSPGPLACIAPLWIVTLWMAFATLIHPSMSWLQGRTVLASIFGAIMAPLSYLAAARVNALQLLEPAWISLTAIAAIWSIAMPCALFLSATFNRGAIAKRLPLKS